MPTGAGTRVLCVDDNADVATTLVAVFDLSGFDARCCHDGQSALTLAAEYRPHVCVLDINMPVMDGCELARRLRAALGLDLVLVAVSADSGDEFEAKVAAAGFDHWFTKPPDLARLVATVAAAAGRRRPAPSPPPRHPLRR